VNGCALGVQRIQRLCDRLGGGTVEAAFDELLDACERSIREDILPLIPGGRFAFEDFVEFVGVSPAEPRQFIRIAVALEREGDRLVIDLAGTDAQVAGALNFPVDDRYYVKALMTVFRGIQPDLLLNDGVLRVVEVRRPSGSVVSPLFPAASGSCMSVLMRALSVTAAAVSVATNGRGSQGVDGSAGVNLIGSDPETGASFSFGLGMPGGSAGRALGDGDDVVSPSHGRNLPVEYVEARHPATVLERALHEDSAGAGAHRGGLGGRARIRFDAPMRIRARTDRSHLRPVGVNGGEPGTLATFVLNPGTPEERALPGKGPDVAVREGDVLQVTSPSGPGWGDPFARDSAAVEQDVGEGLVTASQARERYGVVLGDPARTARLREGRAGRRQPFDRGPEFEKLRESGAVALSADQ
jgi:N-methylhydantoinase B